MKSASALAGTGVATVFGATRVAHMENVMARGDKSSYTGKQKRKAEHIEEGYEKRGVSKKTAAKRAWATVNKQDGGGKQSGSGKATKKSAARKKTAASKKSSASKSSASRKSGTARKKTTARKKSAGRKTASKRARARS
jgi:plasmid stabilization system protein ParE